MSWKKWAEQRNLLTTRAGGKHSRGTWEGLELARGPETIEKKTCKQIYLDGGQDPLLSAGVLSIQDTG